MSQSVLVFGVMTGALVFSLLADIFGRKPIFLQIQWVLVVVGLANAYVTNYYGYLVLRFFTGALQQVSESVRVFACVRLHVRVA